MYMLKPARPLTSQVACSAVWKVWFPVEAAQKADNVASSAK